MFSMWMSVCQQNALNVMSTVIVAQSDEFDWRNIFLWKLLQSDVLISLDQRIIN